MEINVAVVYTEYQLLQTESIVSYYKLKNVVLIIHNKNNRVPDWLIDHTLFNNVISLPLMDTSHAYKLSKKYINYYCNFVSNLFRNKKINTLIGAQDENTIFAIIKYYARPRHYWNIEDGSANYLRRNIRYRLQIFFKKTLFSLYGYRKLDIRYGHGLVDSDKAFRIYPKLSVGRKDCIYLGDMLGNYLKEKVEKIRPLLEWVERYKCFDTLVVSELALLGDKSRHSANELYKFHPEDRPEFKNITYIKEQIPLEFLPFLLNNIKTIRYQSASSSILIMSVLNIEIKIQVDYTPPNKSFRFYTNNIIREFGDKIEVLPC